MGAPLPPDLQTMFGGAGDTFIVRVKGETMVDEFICDGDMVVCRRTDFARDGQMVVALIDESEATLKLYYREGENVRLRPGNKTMESRTLPKERVVIQGVVIGLLREY